MKISKQQLKDVILTSYNALKEVQKETDGYIVFDSSSVLRLGITLLIEGSRNGNSVYSDNGTEDHTDVRIGWGKFRGKMISEIVKADRNYAIWISKKAKDVVLRDQCKRLLTEHPLSQKQVVIPKVTH